MQNGIHIDSKYTVCYNAIASSSPAKAGISVNNSRQLAPITKIK